MKYPSSGSAAIRNACIALTLALTAGLCNQAQAESLIALPASVNLLVERYPEETITTSAQADKALAEVKIERTDVEARTSAAEQVCYTKFFASRCVEGAREERRESLVLLRRIEVQANSVKRRLRAEERDAVLARQREAELASAPQREKDEAAARAAALKKAEARAARQVSQDAAAVKNAKREEAALAKRGIEPGSPAAAAALGTDLRAQEHLDRQEKANAKEAARAEKREANARRFEGKVEAAEKRQQKVAEKKADKEAARLAKEARLKAQAEAKARAEAAAQAARTGG